MKLYRNIIISFIFANIYHRFNPLLIILFFPLTRVSNCSINHYFYQQNTVFLEFKIDYIMRPN